MQFTYLQNHLSWFFCNIIDNFTTLKIMDEIDHGKNFAYSDEY